MATFSKNLSITSSGVYTLEMNLVPTGSTVTPVNDIQTWLHCANIWNKNYTTLAQVLADTSTLNSLIQSNNAADYMARSTEWASNPGLVPKMTSDTTPSGQASASSVYSAVGSPAYKAFDGTESGTSCDWIASSTNTSQYLTYMFPSAVCVKKASIIFSTPKFSNTVKFRIQGSNDGSTYTNLSTEQSITGNGSTVAPYANPVKEVTFNNTTSYRYYRLQFFSQIFVDASKFLGVITLQYYAKNFQTITENQTAMTYIGASTYCANKLLSNSTWCTAICNSTYFEKVLTTKVPTMTSNTTPSGEAIGSNEGSNTKFYMAFDGSDSPAWQSSGTFPGQWCGFDFKKQVLVKKAKYYGYNYGTNEHVIKIQGSNNKSSWTDLSGNLNVNNNYPTESIPLTLSNSTFRYFRFLAVNPQSGSSFGIYTGQFWGRG